MFSVLLVGSPASDWTARLVDRSRDGFGDRLFLNIVMSIWSFSHLMYEKISLGDGLSVYG